MDGGFCNKILTLSRNNYFLILYYLFIRNENGNIPSVLYNIALTVYDSSGCSRVPGTKNWNVDNLGPIYIPEAGKTVVLNSETIPFYKKVSRKSFYSRPLNNKN